MANINAPNLEYFESFANEIEGKFRRLQKIIKHPTATGDYHEEILRSVLRNFLSKRFSVKKGFIYSGPDKVSKQIDLMVIDEDSPAAYIFQEGDFAVVLPQAVAAVMEIKTTLNAKAFDESLENIASAKSLMDYPSNLTGIIFGFSGTGPNSRNLDRFVAWFNRPIPKKFEDQTQMIPDAIMFFDAKSLLVRCNEEGQMAPQGQYYHLTGTDDVGELHGAHYQLSIILAIIISACERKAFTFAATKSQAFNLVQLERGGLSNTRFSFGKRLSQLATETPKLSR